MAFRRSAVKHKPSNRTRCHGEATGRGIDDGTGRRPSVIDQRLTSLPVLPASLQNIADAVVTSNKCGRHSAVRAVPNADIGKTVVGYGSRCELRM